MVSPPEAGRDLVVVLRTHQHPQTVTELVDADVAQKVTGVKDASAAADLLSAEEQDADGGKRKTVTLHVACGIRRPWPDGAVWTDAQKADFPGTPAGLEQAAAWLEERLAESDVGGGRIGV